MLKTLPLPPHRFHWFCATALAPLTLGITVLTGAISPAKAQLIIQQGVPTYGFPQHGVPQQSSGSFVYGSPIPSPIPINPTTGMSDRGSSNYYRVNPNSYPSYPDYSQGYPDGYYQGYPDSYYRGYPNSYPSYPSYPVGSNRRVNNSTLINPTLINPQIRDSILINPVIVRPRGNRRHFNRPRQIIIR
ncbi:hypothetical protein [Coleofasciculus sp. FACHB-1120]|uniref:hypothetical protein n=1 Tax=Coleofasciculus sp. FACHB-1120 TaxID=2692783 RepID=UPI0016878D63|nr:hypothetical protein [Coleofasciculus sp. FACHB-1120]MBD2741133.1 hypothetical protein [Coleofasciculus sp. FACHB-1120]